MLGVTVSVTGRLMTSGDVGAALVVGKAVLVVGAALQHPQERQHHSDVDREWPPLPCPSSVLRPLSTWVAHTFLCSSASLTWGHLCWWRAKLKCWWEELWW